MPKQVCIIGASGKLGSRLTELLAKNQEYTLKGIVRDKKKIPGQLLKYPSIEWAEINDIKNNEKLAEALAGCDAVINTSYVWFAPYIFEAIKHSGSRPEHVIFTGSTAIYTKVESRSPAKRKAGEKAVIHNPLQIPWTIIRPTMIFGHKNDGNISRLIKAIRQYPVFPIIGSGENLIQPIYIYDLIRYFEEAILQPKHYNKIYDVGSAYPISNKRLFKTIARKLNKKIWFISVPPKPAIWFIKTMRKLGLKSPVSAEQILRFQEDKHIDLFPACKAFTVKPKSFEEALEEMLSTNAI